jgi:threonine/homoserine/homoserine lactone efflux protein
VAAAALGLSALILSSARAFEVVRWAGALWLIWLGLRTLLGREGAARARARRRRGLDAFVVATLNPKTAVFFLAFLPQFLDPAGSAWAQTLVLGLTFVALGAALNAVWALAGSRAAERLSSPRATRVRRRASGGVLIGLGVLTAAAPGRAPAARS